MQNDKSFQKEAMELDEAAWSCNDELVEQLWKEFQSLFPCEASVRKAFLSIMKAKYLLCCKYCFSENLKIGIDNRTYRCSDCHKQSSVTAGTFFQGARRLRAWFAAIWFIEQGAYISSAKFSLLVEVRQSSAWGILRSVFAAIDMNNRSRGISARGIGSLHFMELFCKRSLLTPRWEMPQSEEYFQRHLSKVYESSAPFPSDTAVPELKHETNEIETDLNEPAMSVLNSLIDGDLSYDSLLRVLEISERELLEVLTDLELSGLVVAIAGSKFQLTKLGVSLLKARNEKSEEASFDFDLGTNSQDQDSSSSSSTSSAGEKFQEFSQTDSNGSFWQTEPEGFKSSIRDAIEFERPDLDCWEKSKLRDVPLLQQKANECLLRDCGIFGCQICAEGAANVQIALRCAKEFLGFMNKNRMSFSRKYLQIIISVERYRNKTLAKSNRTRHDWHGQGSQTVGGLLSNPLDVQTDSDVPRLDSSLGSGDSLFDVCIAAGYIRRNLIRGFLTPLLVNC
jgi:transposase-like protein